MESTTSGITSDAGQSVKRTTLRVTPAMAKNNKSSIDEGLAWLTKHNVPRQPLTLEQIAEACQCSKNRIAQIEHLALRKLRARFDYIRDQLLQKR